MYVYVRFWALLYVCTCMYVHVCVYVTFWALRGVQAQRAAQSRFKGHSELYKPLPTLPCCCL